MSIGKNSIARAVNATAKTQPTQNSNSGFTAFQTEKIGCLNIAATPKNAEPVIKSVEKYGVICPVLIAVTQSGDAWLLDGYRRLNAAKTLGITQIDAVVINVQNKTEANRLYNELLKFKQTEKDNIHEEKFKILAVKDHDLPPYLL